MTNQQTKSPQLIHPEHLAHLALFPLPNAVLFPHTMLPLHIFEPRYRQMTREALDDGIPICVVKLLDSGELNALGRPATHDIGGAGFILQHQELPDGRFNILLGGAARVRIIEEYMSDRPYRVARAELLPDEPSPPDETERLMRALRGCVMGMQEPYVRLAEGIARAMNSLPDPGALADAIASVILADPNERQRFLECARVQSRLDDVIARISELLLVTKREGSLN
jgi:Lon protease-like protein